MNTQSIATLLAAMGVPVVEVIVMQPQPKPAKPQLVSRALTEDQWQVIREAIELSADLIADSDDVAAILAAIKPV